MQVPIWKSSSLLGFFSLRFSCQAIHVGCMVWYVTILDRPVSSVGLQSVCGLLFVLLCLWFRYFLLQRLRSCRLVPVPWVGEPSIGCQPATWYYLSYTLWWKCIVEDAASSSANVLVHERLDAWILFQVVCGQILRQCGGDRIATDPTLSLRGQLQGIPFLSGHSCPFLIWWVLSRSMLPGGSSVTMLLQCRNRRHQPARLRGHLGRNTVEHRHLLPSVWCQWKLLAVCQPNWIRSWSCWFLVMGHMLHWGEVCTVRGSCTFPGNQRTAFLSVGTGILVIDSILDSSGLSPLVVT